MALAFVIEEGVEGAAGVVADLEVDDPADAGVEESAIDAEVAFGGAEGEFGGGFCVRGEDPAAAVIGEGCQEGARDAGYGAGEFVFGDAEVAEGVGEGAVRAGDGRGVPTVEAFAGDALEVGVDDLAAAAGGGADPIVGDLRLGFDGGGAAFPVRGGREGRRSPGSGYAGEGGGWRGGALRWGSGAG